MTLTTAVTTNVVIDCQKNGLFLTFNIILPNAFGPKALPWGSHIS